MLIFLENEPTISNLSETPLILNLITCNSNTSSASPKFQKYIVILRFIYLQSFKESECKIQSKFFFSQSFLSQSNTYKFPCIAHDRITNFKSKKKIISKFDDQTNSNSVLNVTAYHCSSTRKLTAQIHTKHQVRICLSQIMDNLKYLLQK